MNQPDTTNEFVMTPPDQDEVRPFRISVPEADLDDLRRRVAATRWPDKETVADPSQGVQLETMQALARVWQTGHDWRKVETRLNSLPNFVTTIDGLDIHFIHVRSQHDDALPLIITHGWPGSVIEQLKIIDPLTNPTAYEGEARPTHFIWLFHPCPASGFSAKPTAPGWDPIRSRPLGSSLCGALGTPAMRAGRRLGECRYRADGAAVTSRAGGHSHQHAGNIARGHL